MNRLSAKSVAAQKTPGYYPDGGGLYLQVGATVSKSWLFIYMINRKEREMGLGSALDVSLSDARLKRDDFRKLLREGLDPIEARRNAELEKALATARSLTFRDCANSYIEAHRADWRNEKHCAQWTNTLETYCGDVFGALPVQAIDTRLVLKVLESVWSKKPETASRVRSRIERVLDWAKVRGYRQGENPALWRGHLDKLLPRLEKRKRVKHHPALPFADLPDFMKTLRTQAGIAARALELLILTATRTGEAVNACWSEFDLAGAIWTIPVDRMKAHREHRIPLSARAVAILRELEKARVGDYVFPGKPGRPLSNMALLALLARMDRDDITVHGFRSTFRDWTSESTGYQREVCEMALAHVISDQTEAAYRRGDLFDKRRRLMLEWEKFCATTARGNVLPLKRKQAIAQR